MALTYERVRELLHYNPQTGVLKWKVTPRANVKAGQHAGSVDSNGRLMVMIDKTSHHSGRLIWLWMMGKWPLGVVDHRDRNTLNNRWKNLRDVTQRVNAQNRVVNKTSKSGVRGVYQPKGTSRWHVQIGVDGKRIHVGYYSSFEEAIAARKVAEATFWPQLHGGVL